MITFRELELKEADKIRDIDRSEWIERMYEMREGEMQEIKAGHECPTWEEAELMSLINRCKREIENGGKAIGAFDHERLVGFGVLAHKFRGKNNDQLQVDLMYVSRAYRRRGIGRKIMEALCKEAARRGAKYVYISSTETESAVNFYGSLGSEVTEDVDPELFALEPKDIHMVKKL